MANSAPVFQKDAGNAISAVSTTSTGTFSNGDSFWGTLSADGKKVVFVSNATNLVAGDTNGANDVFVKDLTTGVVTRVSTSASGGEANGLSAEPVFSPDGTKVAFYSLASNLVSGDTNTTYDLYVKDLTTGAITLVSSSAAGVEGNGQSYDTNSKPVFSPDGTKVMFSSSASNLIAGDTNNASDIFIKDLKTGAVTRVSEGVGGVQANNSSSAGVFSADGTKVAFVSSASNLVAGDTNATTDIFVKDLKTGTVTLVSASASGVEGNNASTNVVFSPDGTKVFFSSSASNLVAGDTNNNPDIFMKDLATGEVTRLSTDSSGGQANYGSFGPVVSPDGTKVAFWSYASNLVPGDTNGVADAFVKDLTTGAIVRVSTSAGGVQGNGATNDISFSPDGTKVLITSGANNFASGDSGGGSDLFLKQIPSPSITATTVTDDATKTTLSSSGKIYFSDADSGDVHTASVAAQPGAFGTLTASVQEGSGSNRVEWNYSVDESLAKALKAGATHTDTFAVTLDDGHGGTTTQNVTVTLTGINDAPVISAPASVSFAENGTGAVLKASVADPDGDAVSYALIGKDADLFTIGTDGALAFKAAPDFEAPKDSDHDNVYEVTLVASDGTASTTKAVQVAVTDVAEKANTAPAFLSQSGGGAITLVSTNAAGEEGNNYSMTASFSKDGSKIVFVSGSSNLVPGDTNGAQDVFVKDLSTGAITLVSASAAGVLSDSGSYTPVLSADGKKVAFVSFADNLVAGDTNNQSDIFVKDLTSGAVTRVSTDASGIQGAGESTSPAFSPDGTKIAFVSSSSLVADDTNGALDIYVKDLATGAITRISPDAEPGQGINVSTSPVFSPDGTKLAFVTETVQVGGTNSGPEIYVKDLTTGAVTCISTDAAGTQADSSSSTPVFSPDGTKVAFESSASNLVSGDTNSAQDIFVKDLATGAITRISTDATGMQGDGSSFSAVFSPDGTKVAFASSASNLAGDDSNGTPDIFVKDLTTGAITRISTDATGTGAGDGSYNVAFSPDGTKLIFESDASNLVPGDTNNRRDIFLKVLPQTSATSATLTEHASDKGQYADGNIYFSDADAGDTHTVSIAPHTGALGTLYASVSEGSGGNPHVQWIYNVDEQAVRSLTTGESHTDTFTLTLDDGHGGTTTQDVTVTVNGTDDAPVLSYGSASYQIAENSKAAIATPVSASDPEGHALTYSLAGADAAFFTVDTHGVLAAKWGLDYEAQADANHDNTYNVTVVASDGVNTTSSALAVAVTNVNEAPGIKDTGIQNYAENGTGPVLKIASWDPDGDALTYALGGTDAGLFKVSADGTVSFKAAPDYETPLDANHDNVYDLVLIASDGQLSTQAAYSVKVTDVAETTAPPPIVAPDTGGTVSGTAGSDIIVGGKGSDVLLGGDGNDTVSGGDGFNMLYGEAGNDTLNGGKDFDQLFGGVGDDTIHGGAGNDMIWGEAGHNKLYGDTGDDQIFAGNDGDWLEGGTGRDMLFGGTGADKFVIGGPNANDADQFFNFTSGSDKVVIHGSDYGLAAGALDAAHFQTGSAATGSGGTFLYNPTLGTLAWDADGSGSAAAVTVATVIGGGLTLNDLVIV